MEWKDGLMGTVFRAQVSDNSNDEKWTVCDGPVDALWIENMNTVLDDNKLLTLVNGERIKMNPTMHMLFEVQDLAVASPATVSRCGMVYIDSSTVGWRPYVKMWHRKIPGHVKDDLKTAIFDWIEAYTDDCLDFVRRNGAEYVPTVNLNLVTTLCRLLSTYFDRTTEIDFTKNATDLKPVFGHIFVFCLVWAMGGNLADGKHDAFDSYIKDLFQRKAIADVSIPSSSNNVFSYFVDLKRKCFAVWEDIMPAFKYSSDIPYFQMIVPTADTVKFAYLVELLSLAEYPVLLTGQSGVGKSVIVQQLLRKFSKDKHFVSLALNFSAQTSSNQTQQMIEAKLEKKKKNVLGAPINSKVAIFVDDLNLPKQDTYGSQPPLELLRQLIDCGGLYDRELLTWKEIQDTIILSACGPPGGGRNNISPRLVRQFSVLNIPVQTDTTMTSIFRTILEGFFKSFTTEIRSLCEAAVATSCEIYRRMSTDLLPTPTKSHYTFNLRDLSKVFQGVLQVKPTVVQTKNDLVRLLYHEVSRIFHDRLINTQDRTFFNSIITELIEKNFSISIGKEMNLYDVIFGDFNKRGVPVEDRVYVEIMDGASYNALLDEYLEEYNVTSNKDVRLIFFKDARQHVARIVRILRQPRGNALLVGVGGTGKQSLTRLACHILEYPCMQIELTRAYGVNEWKEDLRKVYRIAGLQGKHVVFLLTDAQVKTEAFLEDVNSILNTGEVPNLFEVDERERILAELRQVARDKGLPEDRDSIANFFSERIRDYLHVVFATSPVGETFRTRCRMFPSLVNCVTIDWFDEWPAEALLAVSQRSFEFIDVGSDEMRANLAKACVSVHTSVQAMAQRFYFELKRRYYTTPTSYLELISLYMSMLQEKRKEIGSNREKLRNGLSKLAETNVLVAKMQQELEELAPELKQKAQDVEALMMKITKDQDMADQVRKHVREEEAIVRVKAEETEAIASEAQKDLDQALPALESAYKALDSLDKKDIAELKVFTKPPDLVLMVMEAICILFKMKPDWESSKKLLSDPQFMKKMQEFDKDNIPETVTKKLKKYIEMPNFNPESVEKVSKACKSMSMWVIALDLYSKVFKDVEPKRKKLEEAKKALEETQSKLAEKTMQLQQVEKQLERLKNTYENSLNEKKVLSDKAEETSQRLQRAGKLTTALADEQIRWAESVLNLDNQMNSLLGNVFLCAASVAYFGAFTSTYREALIAEWNKFCVECNIPVSVRFSLQENLVDPAVIREWNMQGLPADSLSTENGILVTRSRRWPLMIDPQGQANRWIKVMEGANLKCLKQSDPKLLRSLEAAVRLGQSVLLEDVGEQLDPILEPLLLKQTFRQGGRLLIRLGDSMIEYDKNFKLYITTKLPNPHYLPETCIKVTIINFTVTKSGLRGQLLADVVKLEKPELEEQRNTLIVNIANDKKQLKDIEEKILKLLFNSKGNILDDEELINTLNQSKVTSQAIKERVTQAEATERDINVAREKYLPVANRGSISYFVMADLAEIDPMYQFSLKYFKNLFTTCILESPKSSNLEERINTLCKNCTFKIFSNVSRGLFDKHKLIYSFMICGEILKDRGDILAEEWNFFLRGAAVTGKVADRPKAAWLTQAMWETVCGLSASMPTFAHVKDDILNYTDDYDQFINSGNPLAATIPWNSQHPLSPFKRLLMIKVLREEKLVGAMLEFVKINLGIEYVDIPPLEIAKVFKDTSPNLPLVFILSPGSDPVASLMKLASSKDFNMQDRTHMISLGQGQGVIAEVMLAKSLQKGDWLFLQNCHLAASWMPKLEALVKDFSEQQELNPSFRLFLSSMPSTIFPTSILQESVKVTNEPPKGLRANLAKSFADISRDMYDDSPPQGVKFKKLLFGLAFFNAIIQERKKFGPLGWNIVYDWSNSDLEVSISILRNMLHEETKNLPWDALRYLTGEISFGGRVTDDWDRRTLNTLLCKYYTAEILEESYKFSPSGKYYAPADCTLQQARQYIDSLPFSEDPSVFGMHDNANVSYQIQESRRIIKNILDVQPRIASTGAGKTSEDIVEEKASDILESLPAQFKVDDYATGRVENPISIELFKKDESGRTLNALSTVLLQEMVRFNKLLRVIKTSLDQLIKAMKGLVVMSPDLELVFRSLLNNEVLFILFLFYQELIFVDSRQVGCSCVSFAEIIGILGKGPSSKNRIHAQLG